MNFPIKTQEIIETIINRHNILTMKNKNDDDIIVDIIKDDQLKYNVINTPLNYYKVTESVNKLNNKYIILVLYDLLKTKLKSYFLNNVDGYK